MSMPFIPPINGEGLELRPDEFKDDLPSRRKTLDEGETLDSRDAVEQDIAEITASKRRLAE